MPPLAPRDSLTRWWLTERRWSALCSIWPPCGLSRWTPRSTRSGWTDCCMRVWGMTGGSPRRWCNALLPGTRRRHHLGRDRELGRLVGFRAGGASRRLAALGRGWRRRSLRSRRRHRWSSRSLWLRRLRREPWGRGGRSRGGAAGAGAGPGPTPGAEEDTTVGRCRFTRVNHGLTALGFNAET